MLLPRELGVLFTVVVDHIYDGIQRVVQKMRIDLMLQRFQFGFTLVLLFRNDLIHQIADLTDHFVVGEGKIGHFFDRNAVFYGYGRHFPFDLRHCRFKFFDRHGDFSGDKQRRADACRKHSGRKDDYDDEKAFNRLFYVVGIIKNRNAPGGISDGVEVERECVSACMHVILSQNHVFEKAKILCGVLRRGIYDVILIVNDGNMSAFSQVGFVVELNDLFKVDHHFQNDFFMKFSVCQGLGEDDIIYVGVVVDHRFKKMNGLIF